MNEITLRQLTATELDALDAWLDAIIASPDAAARSARLAEHPPQLSPPDLAGAACRGRT